MLQLYCRLNSDLTRLKAHLSHAKTKFNRNNRQGQLVDVLVSVNNASGVNPD